MKKFLIVFISIFLYSSSSALAVDPTQLLPDSTQNAYLYDGSSFGSSSIINWGTSGYGSSLTGFIYTPKESHYVCQVDFHIRKNGNPTDTFALFVRSNATDNLLDGDAFTESSNNWSGTDFLTTTVYTTSFWFGTPTPPANCFGVQKDVSYSFYLQRTGSLSFTDSYAVNVNTASDPSTETQYATSIGTNPNAPYVQIYGIANGSSIDNALNDTSTFCQGLGFFTPLCENLTFLLIPNQATLQEDIEDLKSALMEKAPFAYVLSALNLNFDELNASDTPPTISIPIDVQVAGATTLDTQMTWNDAQGENMVSDLASMIRPSFVVLLWLVLVFYLFVTIKHIL